MQSSELKLALKILQTTYRTEISPALVAVFWKFFAEVPSVKFAEALESHISNPDQGRFFPTPAHVLAYLVMTDQQISNDAGIEFDRDPTVDGMPSFDANRENAFHAAHDARSTAKARLPEWQREHRTSTSSRTLTRSAGTQASAIRQRHQGAKSHG